MKFAYLPLILLSVVALKFVPALAVAKVRIGFPLCGLCACCARWGNHVEEWYNAKPLLMATETGLVCEDGGDPTLYPWADVSDVMLCRRTDPWLTNGTAYFDPPFWLVIRALREEKENFITVWPREVRGGLFAMRRFAATMKGYRDKAISAEQHNDQEGNG